MEIRIREEIFTLHSSGALFRHRGEELFIADLHIGKVNHFRKSGLAVPAMAKYANFDRLSAVTEYFQPKELYFLGDLFHSYKNEEWDAFVAWIEEEEVPCHLIMGNHDIWDIGSLPTQFLTVYKEYETSGFHFTHEPEERENTFNVCGHIHPGVRLAGKGRQRAKLACFAEYENRLILPPFGVFTGLYVLDPSEMKQAYIPVEDAVIALK